MVSLFNSSATGRDPELTKFIFEGTKSLSDTTKNLSDIIKTLENGTKLKINNNDAIFGYRHPTVAGILMNTPEFNTSTKLLYISNAGDYYLSNDQGKTFNKIDKATGKPILGLDKKTPIGCDIPYFGLSNGGFYENKVGLISVLIDFPRKEMEILKEIFSFNGPVTSFPNKVDVMSLSYLVSDGLKKNIKFITKIGDRCYSILSFDDTTSKFRFNLLENKNGVYSATNTIEDYKFDRKKYVFSK